jgi:general secretion pathway protein I
MTEYRQPRRVRSARGFTLIEVLVAMTVVAVALAATVRIGSSSSANAARLEGKTFGHWVALNRLEEIRTERSWPPATNRSGTEEMGGRVWRWTQESEETADPNVRRVQIRVGPDQDPDDVQASLTGFIGRPPADIAGRP